MTAAHPAELRALADVALRAAEEAAAVVQAGFRSRPRVEKKAPADLVTEFDRASEDLLIERLAALSPGVPVVGEERSGPGATAARAGLVWYVDPLDGTTNFVHGHPFWCVSVGLLEDDVPVAGAVVAPMLNLRWRAWCPRDRAPRPAVPTDLDPERAGEARRNGERCEVSATADLRDALIATGFPSKRDVAPDNNFDSFIAVKRRAQAVRRCGSAAIDLCMVGDGTYDGYWERKLHAWDIAAGAAIVRAAGGVITALDGGPIDYHTGHLVASNGLIHPELTRAIHAAPGTES